VAGKAELGFRMSYPLHVRVLRDVRASVHVVADAVIVRVRALTSMGSAGAVDEQRSITPIPPSMSPSAGPPSTPGPLSMTGASGSTAPSLELRVSSAQAVRARTNRMGVMPLIWCSQLEMRATLCDAHSKMWWSYRGSNPAPRECGSRALPAELQPRISGRLHRLWVKQGARRRRRFTLGVRTAASASPS
jgi:hypothetical protein